MHESSVRRDTEGSEPIGNIIKFQNWYEYVMSRLPLILFTVSFPIPPVMTLLFSYPECISL